MNLFRVGAKHSTGPPRQVLRNPVLILKVTFHNTVIEMDFWTLYYISDVAPDTEASKLVSRMSGTSRQISVSRLVSF